MSDLPWTGITRIIMSLPIPNEAWTNKGGNSWGHIWVVNKKWFFLLCFTWVYITFKSSFLVELNSPKSLTLESRTTYRTKHSIPCYVQAIYKTKFVNQKDWNICFLRLYTVFLIEINVLLLEKHLFFGIHKKSGRIFAENVLHVCVIFARFLLRQRIKHCLFHARI